MSLERLTTASSHDAPHSDLYRLTTKAESLVTQFNSFIINAQIELAPTTVKDYRYKLKAFIGYCLDASITRIEDVNSDVARGFIVTMQQAGKSPKSINDFYKVIRRFFSWLVEEERLDKNPIARVKTPRIPRTIIKPFTPEHIRKILLLCEHGGHSGIRNKAMVLVLLDTGIRISELTRMKLNDIDISSRTITVMGKGARQRLVGISKPTLKAIVNYCESRPAQHDQLWLSEEGHPLTVDGIGMVFKVLKDRAGFNDVRLSAHTFRHTSGTMAMLNGASEREVQLILGHSTPMMTQHYTATITSQYAVQRHKDFSPVDRLNLK